MNQRTPAIFIALEGGEGTGKSTQSALITEVMNENGIRAIMVHEPGTTPLGLHLREYLKSKRRIDHEAELLLFEASRAQLMSEVIRPNLENGISVVSDRFAASSIAYQGYGRHIGPEKVRALNDFATKGLYPDLNIYLDLPPEEGLNRTRGPQIALGLMGLDEQDPQNATEQVRQDTADTRRFEDQPAGFHNRVRKGYQEEILRDPEHWVIINARDTVEEVHREMWQHVAKLIG